MFPQCGFSNTAVGILKALEVDFETFDVLADPDIRVVSTITCQVALYYMAVGLSGAPASTYSRDKREKRAATAVVSHSLCYVVCMCCWSFVLQCFYRASKHTLTGKQSHR
jgi:Glutaredoxin